ncbi:hypothetical protein [Plasmodium yoelii yoelii]|uniref:Uncharacterized protein n=1 Tax=Plasmodium yoelii yoelii TaxID=73239 RepID=Q7RDP9_PLAYO|nr:hypothetical protein [Plasmodium yoelii yoelii]
MMFYIYCSQHGCLIQFWLNINMMHFIQKITIINKIWNNFIIKMNILL